MALEFTLLLDIRLHCGFLVIWFIEDEYEDDGENESCWGRV
jgi:hypothetical protein